MAIFRCFIQTGVYMQKKSTIRLILAVLLLTFGITTQAEIKTIKDVLGLSLIHI